MFSRPRLFVVATVLATLLIGLETPWATAGPLPSWTYSTSFYSWNYGVRSRGGFAVSNDDPSDHTLTRSFVGFDGVSVTPGRTSGPILIGTTVLPDLVTTPYQGTWYFDPTNNLIEAQVQITDANHQSGSAAFRFRVGGWLVAESYGGSLPILPNIVGLSYTLDGPSSQVVPIGGNDYTITFGTIDWGHYYSTLDTPTGGVPVAGTLTASVSVAPINNTPEPSGLVLAVMGLVGSAGLIRRRTHCRRGRAADHGCCV